MSAHQTLRMAVFVALVFGAILLGLGALRASVALDRRFLETRYVGMDLGACWMQEWRPFELSLQCGDDYR